MSELLRIAFSGYPFISAPGMVLLPMCGVVLLFVSFVLVCYGNPPSSGIDPFNTPPGPGVWTTSRRSLFVRLYYFAYEQYPFNVCSYVWGSVCATLSFVGITGGAVLIIMGLVAMLSQSLRILWYMIVGVVGVIPIVILRLYESGWFYHFIVLILVVTIVKMALVIKRYTLIEKFTNLHPVKFTRFYVRAKKEKYCPLLRIE